MFFYLLVLFIVVPFIELALLLYVSSVTSWQFALGLVVVTGIFGSLLARSQGSGVYRRIREELAAGRPVGRELADALMIFVAGALLLTPGILTDAFGFSLLLPPCRAFYRRRLLAWFQANFQVQLTPNGFHATHRSDSEFGRSEVIDSYVVGTRDEDARHLDEP